jgi:lipopolysaccharide transport system permease protein
VLAGVRRDLRARLTGTLFGRTWPLLEPLAYFAVYWFLFTRLLGFRMPELPPEQAGAMGVWMFTGVLVWGAFADGLTRSVHAVEESAHLLTKLAFPAEVLPLQAVLASLALLVPGLFVFEVVCLLTPAWIAPGPQLVLAPLLLVLQGLFTLGLAWIVSAIQVFLKDTAHVLGIALTLAMLSTPVFWVPSPAVLPSIEPWLPLVDLNPLHHLLFAWRAILLGGEPAFLFSDGPWRSIGILTLWSAGALVLGHVVFHLGKRRFADEV